MGQLVILYTFTPIGIKGSSNEKAKSHLLNTQNRLRQSVHADSRTGHADRSFEDRISQALISIQRLLVGRIEGDGSVRVYNNEKASRLLFSA